MLLPVAACTGRLAFLILAVQVSYLSLDMILM